jgi:hypothetical protein
MNLFNWRKRSRTEKEALVERAADSALKTYNKTFVDLAKYDRGERVLHIVSR